LRRKQLNGLIFYRQRNIGNYIVDFYCPAAKLIVELDGGQHYSVEGRAKDKTRDEYLVNLGLNVLRFCDLDVLKNMDGVLSALYEHTKIPPARPHKRSAAELEAFYAFTEGSPRTRT